MPRGVCQPLRQPHVFDCGGLAPPGGPVISCYLNCRGQSRACARQRCLRKPSPDLTCLVSARAMATETGGLVCCRLYLFVVCLHSNTRFLLESGTIMLPMRRTASVRSVSEITV